MAEGQSSCPRVISLRPQFHAVQDLSETGPCSRVVVPTRVDDFHQIRCGLSRNFGALPGQYTPDYGPRVEICPGHLPCHYFPSDYAKTVDITFERYTLVIKHLQQGREATGVVRPSRHVGAKRSERTGFEHNNDILSCVRLWTR